MADVDRIAEVERGDQLGDVGRIGVHLIAVTGLARTAVTAPVMGDHAIAFAEEEHHLIVPVVGAQRPAVVEHDRLRVFRAPVLVENPVPSLVVMVVMAV
jgi:hypothetical protein